MCAESRAGKQDTRPGFGLRQKIPAPVQLGPNLPTRDREGGPRHTRFQNTCATLHGPRCRLAAAEATAVGTLPHTSPLTPGPPVTCSCASSPPDLLPSHARSVASRTAGHGGTPLLCVLAGGMETSQPPRNGAGRRQRAGAADPGTGPRRPAGSRTPGRLPHSTVTTAHRIPCTATLVSHCISKMFSPQRKGNYVRTRRGYPTLSWSSLPDILGSQHHGFTLHTLNVPTLYVNKTSKLGKEVDM